MTVDWYDGRNLYSHREVIGMLALKETESTIQSLLRELKHSVESYHVSYVIPEGNEALGSPRNRILSLNNVSHYMINHRSVGKVPKILTMSRITSEYRRRYREYTLLRRDLPCMKES